MSPSPRKHTERIEIAIPPASSEEGQGVVKRPKVASRAQRAPRHHPLIPSPVCIERSRDAIARWGVRAGPDWYCVPRTPELRCPRTPVSPELQVLCPQNSVPRTPQNSDVTR